MTMDQEKSGMARLTYSAIASLDGYVEDERGIPNPRPSGYEIARSASPQACSRVTARLRSSQISPDPLQHGTAGGTTDSHKLRAL